MDGEGFRGSLNLPWPGPQFHGTPPHDLYRPRVRTLYIYIIGPKRSGLNKHFLVASWKKRSLVCFILLLFSSINLVWFDRFERLLPVPVNPLAPRYFLLVLSLCVCIYANAHYSFYLDNCHKSFDPFFTSLSLSVSPLVHTHRHTHMVYLTMKLQFCIAFF